MLRKIVRFAVCSFIIVMMLFNCFRYKTEGAKKYIKSFKVSKKEIILEEGKEIRIKYSIKVKNKASKKIKVNVLNKDKVKVRIEKNKIVITGNKAGKTAIFVETKGKNKVGKRIKYKIWVTVESKEKYLVDFNTYAESGYIYADKYYSGSTVDLGSTNKKYTDNLGNTYKNGINRRYPIFSLEDSYVEYRVDDYNYLKGKIILNYDYRSNKEDSYMYLYGDGELIYESPSVKKGVDPFEINVDISGIRVLRIEFEGEFGNISFVEPVVGK